MPEPLACRRMPFSARLNLPNIRIAKLWEIPIPESRTENMAFPSLRRRATCTLPFGVYFNALSIRFSTTCFIFPPSAKTITGVFGIFISRSRPEAEIVDCNSLNTSRTIIARSVFPISYPILPCSMRVIFKKSSTTFTMPWLDLKILFATSRTTPDNSPNDPSKSIDAYPLIAVSGAFN